MWNPDSNESHESRTIREKEGATYWKGGQETTGDRGKKMQGKYQCDRGILHTCQKLHNESHYFVQLMHTN